MGKGKKQFVNQKDTMENVHTSLDDFLSIPISLKLKKLIDGMFSCSSIIKYNILLLNIMVFK